MARSTSGPRARARVVGAQTTPGRVSDVALSSNGRWLATASEDGTASLIEVARHGQPRRLAGARLAFHSVAFSPDDRRVVAGTGEGSIKVWDVITLEEVATLQCPGAFVETVVFHPAASC